MARVGHLHRTWRGTSDARFLSHLAFLAILQHVGCADTATGSQLGLPRVLQATATPAPATVGQPFPLPSDMPFAGSDVGTPSPLSLTDTSAGVIALTAAPGNPMTLVPIPVVTLSPATASTTTPVAASTVAPANSGTTAPDTASTVAPVAQTTSGPVAGTPSPAAAATTEAPASNPSPAPAGSTTDAPAGPTTGAPAGPTTGAPAGPTTGAPAGPTTGAPAGPTTGAPAGPTTDAPAGSTTDAPAGSTTGAPAGPTTGAPAGSTTDAPAGSTTGAPAGSTTSAPAGSTTGAPAGSTTGAPAAPSTSAPAGSTTSAPAGSTTGAPAAPSTSAPAGTTTGAPAAPSTSAPAGPVSSPTVAPVASGPTPTPSVTISAGTPSPGSSAPPVTGAPATTTPSPGVQPTLVGSQTPTPSVLDQATGTPSPVNTTSSDAVSPTVAPTSTLQTAPPYAPSTCSNGIAGVDDGGAVCCKEACGTCGGVGCGTIPGTDGSSDCCPSSIIAAGVVCGEAPCLMDGFTPSPVNPAFFGTAAPVAPSVCSNGMAGYQDGAVCCLEACGQCGGLGCGTIPGTGGSDNCCSSTIRESGIICGEPPCIIDGYTPAPAVVGGGTVAPAASTFCSNGIAGIQDGSACCAANCGQCGGIGCGSIIGTGGQDACCSSIIQTEGESCDVTLEAPCIIEGYTPAPAAADYGTAAPVYPSNCSNGISGYQDLDVCCHESCGRCGGYGCGTIPGTGGSENCCSATIRESGEYCGNGVEAPCIIQEWTPSPVNPAFTGTAPPYVPSNCSNGIPGVQNGAACCVEECGQCGGVGCGTIPGTGGAENCCASRIISSNQICRVNDREAPCVIEGYTPAPAGIPGTLAPYVSSLCSNGIPGVQDEDICCAENCGQCGGTGCGTIPGTGGSDFCCSSNIRDNGTDCSFSYQAPCYIADWVRTPSPTPWVSAAPVVPSICPNGLAGYHDGLACCKMSCGQCGGAGCGNIVGTNGASDCCSSTILANNQTCGGGVVAPCIMEATSAPTSSPAATPEPTAEASVSGNARDFVTNAADGQRASTGLTSLVTAVTAAFLGAAFLGVRHRTGA